MKKMLVLFLSAFMLTACSEEATPEVEAPETEVQETESEETETIEVEMAVDMVENEDGSVQFVGETNLPDAGELMFTFDQGSPETRSQSKATIQDGAFESDKHTAEGGFPAGAYTLAISLSIPTTQPDEFVKKAGEEYENLTGDLMEDGVVGKSLSYETEFIIE